MKKDIHPKYIPVKLTCSCGETFETHWASSKDTYHVEACSKCHSAYTGKNTQAQLLGGRVSQFNLKYRQGRGATPAA